MPLDSKFSGLSMDAYILFLSQYKDEFQKHSITEKAYVEKVGHERTLDVSEGKRTSDRDRSVQ